jgi:putative FmdB family regulatory protein
MPFYDLECKSCGHTWDDLVKSYSALPLCPKCDSAFTTITISQGAIMMGSAQERISNRANNPSSPNPKIYYKFPRKIKKTN